MMRDGKPLYTPNGAVQWCWFRGVLGVFGVWHRVVDVLVHRHRDELRVWEDM